MTRLNNQILDTFKEYHMNKEAKSLSFSHNPSSYQLFNQHYLTQLEKESVSLNDSIRICLHKDSNELLHNMIIAHPKNKYIRPHKNPKNPKTYHHLHGEMLAIGLNERQEVLFKTTLNKSTPILRIEPNIYLLLFVQTPCCIFHEIALGPFERNQNTLFASWSPEEKDEVRVKQFIEKYI